jgi:hypothetical protein
MITAQQIIQNNAYENEILELIELQVKNDDSSLTQSDLQGAVQALVMKIREGK